MQTKIFQTFFIFSFVLSLTGCSSVPETLSEQGIERISQLPPEARNKIQRSLKKNIDPVSAPEIHQYLTGIAKKILAANKLPSKMKLQAIAHQGGAKEKPMVWIIPPDLGYIDVTILKSLSFENEIAALFAFNWERTQDLEFEKRFINELDQPVPDFRKIYEFSELQDLGAVEAAVDLLYNAGYDPRGLISMFDRKTTVEKERALLLQDKARRTIAFYKPLLNPVVRTNEYYQMRKKLDKL